MWFVPSLSSPSAVAANPLTLACARIRSWQVFVGETCKEHSIPHVINNAYGLQSSKSVHDLCINPFTRTAKPSLPSVCAAGLAT